MISAHLQGRGMLAMRSVGRLVGKSSHLQALRLVKAMSSPVNKQYCFQHRKKKVRCPCEMCCCSCIYILNYSSRKIEKYMHGLFGFSWDPSVRPLGAVCIRIYRADRRCDFGVGYEYPSFCAISMIQQLLHSPVYDTTEAERGTMWLQKCRVHAALLGWRTELMETRGRNKKKKSNERRNTATNMLYI